MKSTNICLYLVVILAAGLVSWLTFNHFPWILNPDGKEVATAIEKTMLAEATVTNASNHWVIEKHKEIGQAVDRYRAMEHIFVYFLAGGLAMLVLWWGEKTIFPIYAKTHWKVVLPLWILPIFCLGTPIAENSSFWYTWLILCTYGMILLMSAYTLLYHLYRKGRNDRKLPTSA